MKTILVSIIVPCYNMGSKIHRLLDSILNQTYQHLQVIIVNDGSTDNSAGVINSYKLRFQQQGIEVEYIYQENRGLGGAVNTGLKYIKGDYFCWPDADDWLSPDSIEKKMTFLETHQDYGFVRSDASVYLESDLANPIGRISRNSPDRFKEVNLMEDYILENNIIFCPGCHMVRTSAFKMVNPNMDIYEGRRGQNYQILLPMLYKYKFGFIDECLYHYVICSGSMSKGDDTYNKVLDRYNGLQTYIIETLKRMDMNKADFEYYSDLTYQKYYMKKALCAYDYGLKGEYIKYSVKMTNSGMRKQLSNSDFAYNIPFMFFVHKKSVEFRNALKRWSTLYRLYRLWAQ